MGTGSGAHRVLVVLLCSAVAVTHARFPYECYDKHNKPQRCLCDFENAAFGLEVEASNTCGEEEPTLYCVQSGSSTNHSCEFCERGHHPPSAMTDLQSQGNVTWWQSETMFDGLQDPGSVNLTFPLNKAYDITYVRILFHSPRPESFVIYKRTKKDGPWVPFQYYSSDCRNTYGLEDRAYALESDQTVPLCTSAYSDISPLSGGTIAFATLEGRKSAQMDFDHNAALHDWVTATDIRIQLNRMNTFGDEVWGGDNVFRSYFYAISEISIGARCKCNGHANLCDQISLPDGSRGRRCRCEHNTAGDDCERCADFYQDNKWKRATASDPAACVGGTDVDLEPELPVASRMPTPNIPSTSSGKKKAPRTLAVAAEIEERARQNATRREQAAELHNLRLAEVQTRLAIAQEDLKRAQLETEHKEELWRMEERAFREKMGWDED